MGILTLAAAMKADRLSDFIAQEEARGVGPINAPDLDRALSHAITAPRSADQTLRSPSADGSTDR